MLAQTDRDWFKPEDNVRHTEEDCVHVVGYVWVSRIHAEHARGQHRIHAWASV